MAHRWVKQPNGKLAIFSSVVDDFVAWHCNKWEVLLHTHSAMGFEIEGGIKNIESVESGNTDAWEDRVKWVQTVHGKKKAKECREGHAEPDDTVWDEYFADVEVPNFETVESAQEWLVKHLDNLNLVAAVLWKLSNKAA